MIELEDGKDIENFDYIECVIEYEHTIATQQYENLKPKIIMKLPRFNMTECEKALEMARTLLRREHIKINKNKSMADKK